MAATSPSENSKTGDLTRQSLVSGRPWSNLQPFWQEGRFWNEYWTLVRDPVYRGQDVIPGQGQPVLLIPGFMAGDYTLFTLRDWLTRIGYRPELAGISFNFWYSEKLLQGLAQRLLKLYRQSRQRITMVGHSRGGLLGKVLAHRHPDLVQEVIGLGSPFKNPYDVLPVTMGWLRAAQAANWVRFRTSASVEEKPFLTDLAAPPKVPVTSIYTRSDGVVNWQACVRPDLACYDVDGSHTGLAVNRDVFCLLSRLLPKS